MYRSQIETVLKLDAHSRHIFAGCCAIDELATTTTATTSSSTDRHWRPHHRRRGGGGGCSGSGRGGGRRGGGIRQRRAYIINYDESSEPGSHWVAVFNAVPSYLPSSSSSSSSLPEFFDPAGLPPLDGRIKFYLLGANYEYNPNVLQQVQGNACGFYCVYYILQRIRGVSANDIIEFLSAISSSRSDHYVKDFIYSQFKPVFN